MGTGMRCRVPRLVRAYDLRLRESFVLRRLSAPLSKYDAYIASH